MSLILDALNRSRQDQHAVPGLATQHPVEPLTARRRQYLLWAALAVAVAVIGALLVDRLRAPPAPEDDIGAPVAELSRNIGSAVTSVTTELKARAAAAEQAQATAAASTTAVPADSPPPPAEPVAATTVPAAAQPASDPGEEATPAAAAPATTAPESTAEPLTSPRAVVSPPQDAAVAELYANRDLEEEPAAREPEASTTERGESADDLELRRARDVERILAEARDEMENASLADHPAPFLADLSQLTKDSIPTLYYQRHDYSSNASESSVTLNSNSIKVGGSVLPGMKVVEILPDSVVLEFQGTQFRLRALNSWVNL